MPRNRASAKAAGSRFERQIADYLAQQLNDERIDRAPKYGAGDRGDIANVYIHGHKLALELKNCSRTNLPEWTREAQVEAHNAGALAGLVIYKRHGVGDPGKQWVTCTVDDLISLITGVPS